MSFAYRKLGMNCIQLIYPLNWKDDQLKKNFSNNKESNKDSLSDKLDASDSWEEFMDGDSLLNSEPYDSHDGVDERLHHYYPSNLDLKNDEDLKLIPEKQVAQYFHPNVQHILFPETSPDQDDRKSKNKGLRMFRYKGKPKNYLGLYSEDLKELESLEGTVNSAELEQAIKDKISPVLLEWMATELYQFQDMYYLVVRVSIIPNCEYDFKGKFHVNDVDDYMQTKSVKSFADWARVSNRIRQNYQKFDGQRYLAIMEDQDSDRDKMFIDHVNHFVENTSVLKDYLQLSSVEKKDKERFELYIEPNAFLHGFVHQETGGPGLNEDELYALLSIDEWIGESGGTPEFRQQMIDRHTYKRWENRGTYQTAIDYGAVTIVTGSNENQPYEGTQRKFGFVSKVLYQHHCMHYTLLILLQLHYREELQKILKEFSQLKTITDSKEEQEVVERYYNLNQYFVFDRLTNEIQGLELWYFYECIFGTKALYQSVKNDMNELNQRLIESGNRQQSKEVKTLTVVAGLAGVLSLNQLADNPFSILINSPSALVNDSSVPLSSEINYGLLIVNLISLSLFVYMGYKACKLIKEKWFKKK